MTAKVAGFFAYGRRRITALFDAKRNYTIDDFEPRSVAAISIYQEGND